MRICLGIPCFNPEPTQWVKLEAFLGRLESELGERLHVVVVDDGSPRWSEPTRSLRDGIKIIRLERNLGKGGALRAAVEHMPASCEVFAFTDFDLPYELSDVVGVCRAVDGGVDICIADRSAFMSGRTSDRVSRRLGHGLFRFITRVLITGGIFDTQAGLKAYQAAAVRQIVAKSVLTSFIFDLEWLYIALHHKLAVRCWPVVVTDEHKSGRMRSMRVFVMFRDYARLIGRIMARRYDSPGLLDWIRTRLRKIASKAGAR
jgi:glycosyltransferase involved in cell wall biosynthesis